MSEKGVLIDQVSQPDTTPTLAAPTPAPTPAKHPKRPSIRAVDIERLHKLTDQIGVSGPNDSTAERFAGLLTWAASRYNQDLHHEAGTKPQQAPEAPQQPLGQLQSVIVDQASTLAYLTREIEHFRANQPTTPAPSADDTQHLQAELDQLRTDYADLLGRFNQIRAALGLPPESAEAQHEEVQPPAQHEAAAPGRRKQRQATEQAAAPVPPGEGKPSRGLERAARIWAAIQQWNNEPGRPQRDKVVTSASTLEQRFGLFRPTAKAFIQEHSAEIEAHHHQHGLDHPAVLRIHNRTVPDAVWTELKLQGG